jgi:hypothetical protein
MGSLAFRAIEFRRNSHWSLGSDFILRFSETGNLELIATTPAALIWESATAGERFVVQGDGNLVIYNREGEPVWASHTAGHPDAVLVAGDNGSLEVVSAGGSVLWQATGGDIKTEEAEPGGDGNVATLDSSEEPSGEPDKDTE